MATKIYNMSIPLSCIYYKLFILLLFPNLIRLKTILYLLLWCMSGTYQVTSSYRDRGPLVNALCSEPVIVFNLFYLQDTNTKATFFLSLNSHHALEMFLLFAEISLDTEMNLQVKNKILLTNRETFYNCPNKGRSVKRRRMFRNLSAQIS